jgi:ferredoxin
VQDSETALHYVCTHDEARELVKHVDRFWVSNCGCREERGGCGRSRIDVCLMFTPEYSSSGSGMKEIAGEFIEGLFQEAAQKRLVTRPFRDFEKKEGTAGICFCCDDCCGYFVDDDEICDKGAKVEKTVAEACTDCGLCADVCYFKARTMESGRLAVDREKCYGCGLCVDVCPEDCVTMADRLSAS